MVNMKWCQKFFRKICNEKFQNEGNDRLGVFLETYPYWGAEVSLKGKYVDSDSAVTVADWQCLQQSGCKQFLYWHSSILGCLSALLSTLIINTYYQHLPGQFSAIDDSISYS